MALYASVTSSIQVDEPDIECSSLFLQSKRWNLGCSASLMLSKLSAAGPSMTVEGELFAFLQIHLEYSFKIL